MNYDSDQYWYNEFMHILRFSMFDLRDRSCLSVWRSSSTSMNSARSSGFALTDSDDDDDDDGGGMVGDGSGVLFLTAPSFFTVFRLALWALRFEVLGGFSLNLSTMQLERHSRKTS